ncbi:Na/Pi cotransporter family protein [Thetidibacter halocola]|uniref:Na/Pi cotransporter family protein n=1 Tax=Thetidibacter halocola TaxID=2827239 RepID=A0A8J8B7R1_9RHOB|nr:Na/Pi cotransporter family protein [Thetidibacter halocola]MBS0125386.1 Na/Pi cotransporter family protein [Thetidibacter halocola]
MMFVLNVASAAALLVWSVRLVRTGFERAFGAQMRVWLRHSTSNRLRAALCGAVTAILLQSSTAVAVLMAGFVSAGSIGGVSALAMLLGADLGSAIVALVLNSGLSAIAPVLMLSGVLIFLRSGRRAPRQVGRVLIGLALIFVSLDLIRAASAPLVDSPGARAVMAYFGNDLLTAFAVSAVFAWLVHSSVAAVLLYATMAAQGILPLEAALAMVLGANFGGCIIALLLTWNADPTVRRVVWSNLGLRGGGALLVLYALSVPDAPTGWLGDTAGSAALHLHLGFNALILVLCLPLVGIIHRLAQALLPDTPSDPTSPQHQSALDPEALAQPKRALSCATRELVHLGGLVEGMFRQSMTLFGQYDETAAARIAASNAQVERISLDLRVYLAAIRAEDDRDRIVARAFDLVGTGVSLEAAADVIAQAMVPLAAQKSMEKLRFSDEGREELTAFHDTVLRNVQLAIAVLMNGDPALAEALVEQKDKVRDMASTLEARHLVRLQQGGEDTLRTSGIHLDLLRAIKTVNGSFAMIAYPVLNENGKLLKSRLASG